MGVKNPIKIENSLAEIEWRQYVDQQCDGNIFHTPEMYQVFQHVNGFKPEIWVARGVEHQILGLMLPVHITLFKKYLRRLTTRTVVFGGLLFDKTPIGFEAMDFLLKTYKKSVGLKSLFTEIRNSVSYGDFQQNLQNLGFQFEDHLNYLLDLSVSPEEIFNRIGPRTRKNIRHGLNQSKIMMTNVTNVEDVIESYELISNTYHNARVPLSDRSLFISAFNTLYPKGMIMWTNAVIDGSPRATSLELMYKDTVFGWYSGMDRAFASYVPNEMLMWHILQKSAEKGFVEYDFGGAGKPNVNYGVRDFKAKFGGNLVNYGRNIWIPNRPLFNASRLGYAAYCKLFIK